MPKHKDMSWWLGVPIVLMIAVAFCGAVYVVLANGDAIFTGLFTVLLNVLGVFLTAFETLRNAKWDPSVITVIATVIVLSAISRLDRLSAQRWHSIDQRLQEIERRLRD